MIYTFFSISATEYTASLLGVLGSRTPLTILNWVIWGGVVCTFVIIEYFLIHTAIRLPQQDSAFPSSQAPKASQVEIVWTIIPALITAIILVLSLQTLIEQSIH